MASQRDVLLTTLVTRLDGLSGISATLRNSSQTVTAAVLAIVYPDNEDKRLANSNTYDATYSVEVMVIVREEDADAVTDGGNPYRYLDRMVTKVEQAIHTPDSWGIDPDYTDVQITGHQVEDPTDDNEFVARVFVEFRYRHDYQDPEA